MRFIALIQKELRQCLPWILLAAIFFLVLGSLALRNETHPRSIEDRYPAFTPGSDISIYRYSSDPDAHFSNLVRVSPLHTIGNFLILTSIALGLVLGVQQFWMADVRRTWGFTLHRSVTRQTILFAKLAAALLAFVAVPGLIWIVFHWYGRQPEILPLAPTARFFIEGWVFIALGFVIYLATALVGLSTARWYTTKLLGLAFALWIFITICAQWSLTLAFTTIIVGALVLLAQIFSTFLNREF